MKLQQIIAAGIAMAVAGSALAGADSFNRANLGGKWVVAAGSMSISSHHLVGTTGSIGSNATASANTAATVVVSTGGTDLEYGAVALGNIGGGTNAFVKIQSQNGTGSFDHGAFYTGNNGGGTFFTLSSAVPSPAILDVFFCGTVATMRITSAAGVQIYTHDYGTAFVSGAGLGTFGSVGLDNFIGFNSGCADVPTGGRRAVEMPAAKDWTK